MPTINVFLAVNSDGEAAVTLESGAEALDQLANDHGLGDAARVYEIRLVVPAVKPIAVDATLPDTDGPISVTVR